MFVRPRAGRGRFRSFLTLPRDIGCVGSAIAIVVGVTFCSRVKHDFCLALETSNIEGRYLERLSRPRFSKGQGPANPQPIWNRVHFPRERLRDANELDSRTG